MSPFHLAMELNVDSLPGMICRTATKPSVRPSNGLSDCECFGLAGDLNGWRGSGREPELKDSRDLGGRMGYDLL